MKGKLLYVYKPFYLCASAFRVPGCLVKRKSANALLRAYRSVVECEADLTSGKKYTRTLIRHYPFELDHGGYRIKRQVYLLHLRVCEFLCVRKFVFRYLEDRKWSFPKHFTYPEYVFFLNRRCIDNNNINSTTYICMNWTVQTYWCVFI